METTFISSSSSGVAAVSSHGTTSNALNTFASLNRRAIHNQHIAIHNQSLPAINMQNIDPIHTNSTEQHSHRSISTQSHRHTTINTSGTYLNPEVLFYTKLQKPLRFTKFHSVLHQFASNYSYDETTRYAPIFNNSITNPALSVGSRTLTPVHIAPTLAQQCSTSSITNTNNNHSCAQLTLTERKPFTLPIINSSGAETDQITLNNSHTNPVEQEEMDLTLPKQESTASSSPVLPERGLSSEQKGNISPEPFFSQSSSHTIPNNNINLTAQLQNPLLNNNTNNNNSGEMIMNKPPALQYLATNDMQYGTQDSSSVSTPSGENTFNNLQRIRVLLAEDNQVNQKMVLRMLEKLGYPAELAENGEEALQMVLSHEQGYYSIILMDMQMPVLDGEGSAKAIRLREKSDPPRILVAPIIIALTANATLEDRDRCISAGMDDFFVKPVTLEKLKRKLRDWKTEATRRQDQWKINKLKQES